MTAPSPERLALRRFVDEQRAEVGLEPTHGLDVHSPLQAVALAWTAIDNHPFPESTPEPESTPTFDAVAADLGWEP